jgi:hypothetical protein
MKSNKTDIFNKNLLITDADGTLLTDDKRILDTDKAAIFEFLENGGEFTIATGRGVSLARVVVEELGELVNTPAVIFNGAAIYDFKKDEFLWKCSLCEKAQAYFEKLMNAFPNVGVEILIDDDIYVTSTNKYEEDHLELGVMNPIRCDYSEVPKLGWIKILMVDEPKIIDKVIEFTQANPCEQLHMVRSAPMYYEILPQGVNKGTGFKKLLELLGYENQGYRIIAAGDYMNDLEMLQQADIGVATDNAEQIIKEVADVVVCDNNSGVIRDIVELLKKEK